jgi:hypothetical protein
MRMDLNIDAFASWLCSHERDIVGTPGTWFHSPLALWLSEVIGQVYGVDSRWYGRASTEYTQWAYLPQWAQFFLARIESRYPFRAITGEMAFAALAEVEQTLLSLAA